MICGGWEGASGRRRVRAQPAKFDDDNDDDNDDDDNDDDDDDEKFSFIRSFIHSFVHSFIRSFVHSICWLVSCGLPLGFDGSDREVGELCVVVVVGACEVWWLAVG